ncbi:MAG: FtsX-like permease family protein [Dysgonamonadaceae bacterium]|jgi:ABC-type lipoprotein release transport system permease subunit|nr:FtsX-like permease family protein [Dysgonamonadaceae bacterium]
MKAMIPRLAWKNIWRNKVRSGVILGAIALGLFSGTYIESFMNGWIVSTINSDVDTHLSHVQIHDTTFLADCDIHAFFLQMPVSDRIEASGLPALASFRLIVQGMLASANNAVGITVKGVFPEDEKAISTIWKQIPDTLGAFLPDNTRMPVVISKKIAEKLKVKLKSKIVLTFQDAQGEMQSLAFRVCGIYKTTNGLFDEGNVFVRYGDIFPYTGLPGGAVHEAGIKVADLETCKMIAPQMKALLSGLSVQDWGELNPMLSMSLAWMDFFGIIIIVIFLLALSFGIVNTMLMAVLERTRELGMLSAIGMTKGRIFSMIMLETFFLTLLGSIAGMILAALVILPFMSKGIDLSFLMEDQFEDYGFGSVIYPVLTVKIFLQILAPVILAGILSAVYPARKALGLKSLDAIRQ